MGLRRLRFTPFAPGLIGITYAENPPEDLILKKNGPKTGHIIDARVAKMRLKGKLATLNPNNREHWDEDNRKEKTLEVLETIKGVAKDRITVASDKKKSYPNLIHSVLPQAEVQAHDRISDGKNKPLFMLNVTCAKIRADLSRMRRRTWAITRKWENLQKHLYIYIAWNNGYTL